MNLRKTFGLKKKIRFRVLKKFCLKNLGQEKFIGPKNFGSKKFLGPNKILVPAKFWIPCSFSPKKFESKKLMVQNIVSPNKNLD